MLYYKDDSVKLFLGDTLEILKEFSSNSFDMIFSDPPYFLSNGGLTIHSGKIVSVDKAEWDKAKSYMDVNNFNYKWLQKVRDKLRPSGTLWVSCTLHNLFSLGQAINELDYRILNVITWQKSNPPPNFSRKFFTHSTEFIIWARKSKKVSHYYNYKLMKDINDGSQMKDVWKFPAISRWEKNCGKHPTQKPLSLLTRIILASTQKDETILDPFTGSSTTGIAANLCNRKFVGFDYEKSYLDISICRFKEIQKEEVRRSIIKKIQGFDNDYKLEVVLENSNKKKE